MSQRGLDEVLAVWWKEEGDLLRQSGDGEGGGGGVSVDNEDAGGTFAAVGKG